MQGVGPVRSVAATDVTALVDAARRRLARVRPFQLELDKPEFTPEAVRWNPEPASAVADVRAVLRDAIHDVFGRVGEAADGFVPHVTIAYGNRVAPAAAIIAAIESCDVPAATTTVTTADLIVLGRDRHEYEWTYAAKVPLGG
jgi:2'-5' RNA ligase